MICFDPIAPLPSTPAPVTFSTLANGKSALQDLDTAGSHRLPTGLGTKRSKKPFGCPVVEQCKSILEKQSGVCISYFKDLIARKKRELTCNLNIY